LPNLQLRFYLQNLPDAAQKARKKRRIQTCQDLRPLEHKNLAPAGFNAAFNLLLGLIAGISLSYGDKISGSYSSAGFGTSEAADQVGGSSRR
jgi:hypothetical protein